MLDSSLRLFLLEFPGVTDRVGDRIFPAPFPQGSSMPLITYQDPSMGSSASNDGPDCLEVTMYQIDHWAQTREEASDLERVTRERLGGYRGTWPGGVRIGSVFLRNRWTLHEPETQLWRVIADYRVSAFRS